jgi:hypothetical protein
MANAPRPNKKPLNDKYQAEMEAYAKSIGATIPPELGWYYQRLPTSLEISGYNHYRAIQNGNNYNNNATKTPKWAVDNYLKDKPTFYGYLIDDAANNYMGQNAENRKKNIQLPMYIKLAAENGLSAEKATKIILNRAQQSERDRAEFAARNSGGSFSNIGGIDLGGIGRALDSVFGGLGRVVEDAYKGVSNTLAKAEDVVKEDVLPSPIFQIAMAYYMPTIASYLGPYLTAVPAAYQTAVAGALASTALQTAQGVPFETALKNATVNAITNTGAPKVADYILPYAGSPQVADALVSIGASAAKTAAMGGSKDDIERNMLAGLTGSALTSSLQGVDVSRDTSRVAGAAAGGAIVGGTEGAIGGALGELGGQAARDEAAKAKALENAKKGIASADGTTAFDTGQQLPENIVVGQKQPDITDTSIITPTGPITDREVIGAMQPPPPPPPPPPVPPVTPPPSIPALKEVEVKAKPEQDETSIISPDVSVPGKKDGVVTVTGKKEETASLTPVTVTGTKEPTIQDTDITLPETVVTGEGESDVSAEEGKAPVDKQGKYNPNLFIYGGTTLGSSLKTAAPFYPQTSTSGGLTSVRGAGEIESKESGKKRTNVWNEESLRLKDALGL